MVELLNKYMSNEISESELIVLKERLNSTTDDELALYFEELWKCEKGEHISLETVKLLKRNIDTKNKETKHKAFYANFWKNLGRIAAIVAIPLMLLMTYFVRNQSSSELLTEMLVSVGSGEKVNMVLPDGTKVKLNAESSLSYDISVFNKKLREVSLDGEAYFEVAKNEKIPFVIATTHLGVEVLGTRFNLSAREEYSTVELNLIEGKVHLLSVDTKDDIVLYANQRAVLDKNTGKFSVYKANNNVATAWLQNELAFQSTPVEKVFREIERTYGVSIKIDADDVELADLFTGTFSTKNLEETLRILQLHYKFNYKIEDNAVCIENFRLNKKSIN